MNNIIDQETGAEDSQNKDGKRRTSYVSRDHASMVAFVGEIYKNLGHADYHSNKAIAAVHGLSPDSIKQHLTSSQQYRLLEIKFGTGYKVTDLFKKIYLPVNDNEKRAAVIESLKSPETYQQLFKEYEFHIVPPVTGIKNQFVRNFGFKEDIAEKTAQVFLSNLVHYGLLDSRNVLISGMPAKPAYNTSDDNISQKTSPTPEIQIDNSVQTKIEQKQEDDGLFELPIPLPNRRKAYLKYPLDSLTKKDISVITKALEFIASSLEDE